MKIFKFKITLKRPEGIGTWHYVDTPIHVEKEFQTKGKLLVKGKINGISFNATLIPRGNGEHYIVLDKKIREKTAIEIGEEIKLEVWKDTSERKVEISSDFKTSLLTKKNSNTYIEALAYSHKNAYVDWINSAKKEATRSKRIEKALVMLSDKKN